MTFLNTLAELNIPLSLVNNRQAREQYRRLKSHGDGWGGEEEEQEEEEEEYKTPAPLPRRQKEKKVALSPTWTAMKKDKTFPPRRVGRKRKR